jgi:hypothetical protein
MHAQCAAVFDVVSSGSLLWHVIVEVLTASADVAGIIWLTCYLLSLKLALKVSLHYARRLFVTETPYFATALLLFYSKQRITAPVEVSDLFNGF